MRATLPVVEILAAGTAADWDGVMALLQGSATADGGRGVRDQSPNQLLVRLAGLEGSAAALSKLIEMGADPNYQLPDGSTALGAAITGGSEHGLTTIPELTALLDGGADPARIGESGYPALHWAIVNARFNHARLLLQRGADPNQRSADLHPETAFDVARRMRSDVAARLLSEFTPKPTP